MADLAADDPAGIAAHLSELGTVILTTKYALAAALTILVYDYLITLEEEIFSTWKNRISWVSILFFVNRYYWIVAAIMLAPFEAIGAVVPFLTVSQLLVGIRAYALLERRRAVLVFLVLYAAGQFVVGLYLTLRGSIATLPLIPGDAFTICLQSSGAKGSELIAVMLLIALGMDACIFIGTAFATIRASYTGAGLARTIFLDNLRYFTVVLASNATAAILTLHARPEVFAVAGALAASLNTVMASRVTMNLMITALRPHLERSSNRFDSTGDHSNVRWMPQMQIHVSTQRTSTHEEELHDTSQMQHDLTTPTRPNVEVDRMTASSYDLWPGARAI